MQLTSLSAKLAVADMMDVGLANRAVESVINSYQQQANAIEFATHVVDSWTKIAHNAQSSATDLADALMRAGAAAQAVGVDFDTTNALASTMIKVTGRTGAEVGNALKSLFSSIHNEKAIKSLADLGVEVYEFDEEGTRHFRNLQDVFIDLMLTSHTTSKNMERDLLAISGGKFQWSKVAGVLGDYEDFIKSYYLSIKSAGFVNDQVGAQLNTLEAKIQQLKSAWVGFSQNIGSSGLGEALKGLIDTVNNFVTGLQKVPAWVFQMIGSMIKWSAVTYGVTKGIQLLTLLYIPLRAAIMGTTSATVADTVVKNANTMAENLSKGSILSRIVALGAEKVAIAAKTMATQAENAALAEQAALTTAATGGLNLLVAAVAAATVGTALYATTLGEESKALEDVKLKEEELHQAHLQEIAKLGQQERFGKQLIDNYYKLKDALAEMTDGEEKAEKVKRDLAATEEVLKKMLGKEGLEAVKQSKSKTEAYEIEKKIIGEKAEKERDSALESIDNSIKQSEQIISDSKERIRQIQNEIPVWQALARAVASFNMEGVKAALTQAYFGKSREARIKEQENNIANAEKAIEEQGKKRGEVLGAYTQGLLNAEPPDYNGEVPETEEKGGSSGSSSEGDAYREAMREFREALAEAKLNAESQGKYFSKSEEFELFKQVMGDEFAEETRFRADLLNKQRASEKEQRDLSRAGYDADYAKSIVNENFAKALQKSISDSVEAGKPLSEPLEKIRRMMEDSASAYVGSVEKLNAEAKLYQAIYKQQTALEKALHTAREKGIKAIDTMAEKELEFAKSLGLVDEQDIRKYQMQKNEKEHNRNMPYLEAELMKTALAGAEEEMLSAYRAYKMAQTEEDIEYYTRYIFSLSNGVEATRQALDAMLQEDERYYQKKYELETEDFKRANRFAIDMKEAFVSSFEDALNGIMNRTMSFGDAIKSIFKAIFQSIAKRISKDIAEAFDKMLSKAMFKGKDNDNVGGALLGHLGIGGGKKTTVKGQTGGMGTSLLGNLGGMFNIGGMGGKGMKGTPFAPLTKGLDSFKTSLANVRATWTNTMGSFATTASATASTMNNFVTEGVNTFVAGENTKRVASGTTAAVVEADGAAAQTSVSANISAMMTQLLAALAIMLVMSALFGGGGSSESTSTSEVNLGRAPDSYYMTPTPVLQSTTFNVPSFDIGGNIEEDMFAMVHKGEMVLTPEQAQVIRDTATTGGTVGGGANATVKSNINVSTVDSRGFDRVLRDYNRTLSRQVKKGIRSGYLSAKGLV